MEMTPAAMAAALRKEVKEGGARELAFLRVMVAAEYGRGVRLTAEEVQTIAADPRVVELAEEAARAILEEKSE